MDKITQNRHRKEGWEGIEEGGRVFSSFTLSIRSEEVLLNFFRVFDLYQKHITGWK